VFGRRGRSEVSVVDEDEERKCGFGFSEAWLGLGLIMEVMR
jgi:hypothetical protein